MVTVPRSEPDSSTPRKRRWGLGLTGLFLGLGIAGLGIGDFTVGKTSAGVVVLLIGLLLAAAGVVAFRWRYVPDKPLPRLSRAHYLAPILAGALAGLAFPILFPVFGHREQLASGITEILAWVGLIPLCWAIDGLTAKRAFGLGMLAGMAFFNMTFWWVNVAMTTFGGIPSFLSVPVLQMLVAWCALHWGLATWGASLLQRHFRWPLWAALPAPWAATELMRNYFMSGYPWANLGYATSRDLPFAQVAGIGGVYLIAFILVLVNATLYQLLRALLRKDVAIPKAALAACAVLVIGGHLYGWQRIKSIDAALAHAPRAKVAVVQGNIDQKIKNKHTSYVRFILNQYLPETDKAAAEGAQVIIWPEAAYPAYFAPGTISLEGRGLRPDLGANLLLGVQTANEATNRSTNSAFWVRPDLTVAAQYDKHHLVPFGEYVLWDLDRYLPIGALVQDVGLFAPGTELPIWNLELTGGQKLKVGMLICYDAIFPEITRDYAERDVDLLVNITNDAWYGWASAPYQFLRMVQMRAIESGRSLARAANTGVSAFYDPAGRILDQTSLGLVESESDRVDESFHVPSTHLTREVPIVQLPPLYVHIGDVFAYACAVFSILGAGISIFGKRPAI